MKIRSRNETMTTIYLIRHAEAEGNLYRFAQGQSESSITGLGYKQIDALAERFRDIPLDALYSSDLKRTQTTAGAITRYHELTPILSSELREICLGERNAGKTHAIADEQENIFCPFSAE